MQIQKYQNRNQIGAVDSFGQPISVYDIVQINSLPDYLNNDLDESGNYYYRKYLNCIAMIVYQNYGDFEELIWFGKNFYISLDVIFKHDNSFRRMDLSLPINCVKKISPNSELYSIFINFNESIEDDKDGYFFSYKYIFDILKKYT